MARINIEDSLYRDIRFYELKEKLGSLDAALGALVRAWSLAQTYYLNIKTARLIPIIEWNKQKISKEIINTGLAEIRGDYVYVSGSEMQFAWLLQKQEAGKKGGRPPNAIKSNTNNLPLNLDKHSKATESETNPLTLTPTLTPTLTQTHAITQKKERKKSSRGVIDDTPIGITIGSRIFESYSEAYEHRWKNKPVRNATVNSQCSALGKRLGEDAIEVVKFYVMHNDSFFVQKCHPIGLLLQNAEGLRTQWANKKQITKTTAMAAEKKQHVNDVWSEAAKFVEENKK